MEFQCVYRYDDQVNIDDGDLEKMKINWMQYYNQLWIIKQGGCKIYYKMKKSWKNNQKKKQKKMKQKQMELNKNLWIKLLKKNFWKKIKIMLIHHQLMIKEKNKIYHSNNNNNKLINNLLTNK